MTLTTSEATAGSPQPLVALTGPGSLRPTAEAFSASLIRPVIALLLLVASTAASAQDAGTPGQGSGARQAILDAARIKVAADLGYRGDLLFRVDHLKVYQGWALLLGEPVTAAGVQLHKNCMEADEITAVLLRLKDGRWKVERGGVTCANDAFWIGWQEELGAPPQIF